MEEKRKIPFPQANDFNKIIKIIQIVEEKNLSDNSYLLTYLEIGSERQIDYYLSACEFLGLIDKRLFTPLCLEIKGLNYSMFINKICKIIVSSPVFGEVFFTEYLNGLKLSNKEISQFISDVYSIDNIEVCNRRASTVRNWLDWIYENKTENLVL